MLTQISYFKKKKNGILTTPDQKNPEKKAQKSIHKQAFVYVWPRTYKLKENISNLRKKSNYSINSSKKQIRNKFYLLLLAKDKSNAV